MTKSDYENVVVQADVVLQELVNLRDLVVDNQSSLTSIEQADLEIDSVRTWATNEIALINQEVVINSLLNELKVVFDKYNAKMEVGSSESGYGQSYGEGGTSGVKFTAHLDGVVGRKVIEKNVIIGEDLV